MNISGQVKKPFLPTRPSVRRAGRKVVSSSVHFGLHLSAVRDVGCRKSTTPSFLEPGEVVVTAGRVARSAASRPKNDTCVVFGEARMVVPCRQLATFRGDTNWCRSDRRILAV